MLFSYRQAVEIYPHYEHQNQTGKSPNLQYNRFRLILNLYFNRK